MKTRKRLMTRICLGLTLVVLAGLLGILPPAGNTTYSAWAAPNVQAMEYQNVIVVAQSGGDYMHVQAAIDSITDADMNNHYLVWVAPGVYGEQVTMKPYVHLRGAGQEATVITSPATDNSLPPDQATLVLAGGTSLRDLTVRNDGWGDYNVALLAPAGTAQTLVADVTAWARGPSGTNNYAVYLTGSGTAVTLRHVTGLGENGNVNYGLYNRGGAEAVLRGGSFTGRGGNYAGGIWSFGSGTTLEAESITVLAENGSFTNFGLYNGGGSEAVLHGGSFTARGGTYAKGICNESSGTTLEAASVTALGEDGSGGNYGLYNVGAEAVLSSSSFTGREGDDAYGIYNDGSGTRLEATAVTALAEEGSGSNHGLVNINSAEAALRGGSFTARRGEDAYGIYSDGSGTRLEATSVTALAEEGSGSNHGLVNINSAEAALRGGSFTGRGGNKAYGIYTASDTRLEATSVTALGENGSSTNYGLYNDGGAEAVLHGGSFTARGGLSAYGGYSGGSGTRLEAEGVTALGENGGDYNYGLFHTDNAEAMLSDGSFTARGGREAWGIYNELSSTTLEAEGITVLAEDGSDYNYGLKNADGAEAVLSGGSFTAHGGIHAWGIRSSGSGTRLEATSVTALGESGSGNNHGLVNTDSAEAVLGSSSFTGRGGNRAYGIYTGSGTRLEAVGVTALGEEGGSYNYGLYNVGGATAALCGGSFTGRGGIHAWGIRSFGRGTRLETTSVAALGEGGSGNNHGLVNIGSAEAALSGGSFTARGGEDAYGIYSSDSGTRLEATSVTALGEEGRSEDYGLYNVGGAEAVLSGGSFTARGGGVAYGIYNYGSGTRLEAASVTALGEDGSGSNYGLYNYYGAEAVLSSSSFTGRGGDKAYGIYNSYPGTTLEAEGVTALGEDGSSYNYGLYTEGSATTVADSSQFTGSTRGLYMSGGTVRLGVTQVDGGFYKSGGTLTCFQVYDGDYYFTCPP